MPCSVSSTLGFVATALGPKNLGIRVAGEHEESISGLLVQNGGAGESFEAEARWPDKRMSIKYSTCR